MATTPDSRIEQLLAANSTYAQTHTPPISMKQMRQAPGNPVFVLTCMDPRVVPEQFLGPAPRVAVFRNAGGRASPDVVRSINILHSLRDTAENVDVMVVHHHDCGATYLDPEKIEADVQRRGAGSSRGVDMKLFAVDALEKSVIEDVEWLRAEKLLRKARVSGWVLDHDTGLLNEVVGYDG